LVLGQSLRESAKGAKTRKKTPKEKQENKAAVDLFALVPFAFSLLWRFRVKNIGRLNARGI
jgi:hypothetical protein